jgi:hypothetical protein
MTTQAPIENPWLVEESDFPQHGSPEDQVRFLLRYAILAPSVHNTEPWVFGVNGWHVRLFADRNRCLTAADRDMRDLYISLGCALENLVIAAEHFGFHPSITYFPEPQNPMLVASASLGRDGFSSPSEVFGLFRAITARRTNHGPFNQERVSEHDLHHLTACCLDEDIKLTLTADEQTCRQFAAIMLEADILRFADPAYVSELEYWVHQGAYDTPWMVKKLHELASACLHRHAPEYSDTLKGAPVLGIIASSGNDRTTQLRAGRFLERVFLRATALGLSLEPITYVLQVSQTRTKVADLIACSGVPQVAFRLGCSEFEPRHSPRRPLDQSLVTAFETSAVVNTR